MSEVILRGFVLDNHATALSQAEIAATLVDLISRAKDQAT